MHRSLLFAPAIRGDLMAKAERSGADALVFDLEDAVAAAAKQQARALLTEALARPGPSVFVRVNHPDADDTAADIAAAHGERLAGFLLPKAERVADIERVDALLAAAETRLGHALALLPMIETCVGLRNAYDLCRTSARTRGAIIASAEEGDLMVDLGGRWTPGGEAMHYARSRLVVEARAAGVDWLIDGVFMNLADDDALRKECTLARNIGYAAKLAIHPRQLEAIHAAFTPSEAEVDYARGLVQAFRDAERQGLGAVQYRGMMVDYANVKRAERVLAFARRVEPPAATTRTPS